VIISHEALTAILGHEPQVGEDVTQDQFFAVKEMVVTKIVGDDITVEFVAPDGNKYEATFKKHELKPCTEGTN
jgi:hypothetical protein